MPSIPKPPPNAAIPCGKGIAPRVSVCIPAFRGADHIGAAIASVLHQTYPHFELIVIDDNSPDGTVDEVLRFSDPRLRLLRNPQNLGPAGNWSRCLKEARGEYVKLLPQDDLLAPRCLESQIAAMEADTDQTLALVFCARDILRADGRPFLRRGYGSKPSGRVPGATLVRHCLRAGTNLIGEPGAVLFRRSLAERAGGFDASCPYVIDLDYWVRLLAHGDAHYLNEALAGFRISKSSWSVAIGRRQRQDFSQFMAQLAGKPGTPGTALDRARGHLAARINNLLRLLLYRIVIHGRT